MHKDPQWAPSRGLGRSGIVALWLPTVTLVAFVVAYARSFPIWETWYFMPVWRDFHQHGPWLRDLFANRWGHISAIPSFIYLMLDQLSGYDQRLDIFFSVGVAVTTLYLLLRYYVPCNAYLSRIFLGLTFLSLRVSEIWLDGWNMAMTISLFLSVAAGACILATRSWKGLIACALLAFLGLNSGGYCLAVLPAVLAALIAQTWSGTRAPVRKGVAQILAWSCLMGILVTYWVLVRGGSDGGPDAVVRSTLSTDFLPLFVRVHSMMLGDGWLGFTAFAGAIALFAAGILTAGWRRLVSLPSLAGILYMATYSTILTALILTGRTTDGLTPLHLRYIPFLCLLPVALLTTAELLVARGPDEPGHIEETPVHARWRYAINVSLCAFIASAVWNNFQHYFHDSLPNQPQLAALDRAWQRSPWTITPGMFMYRGATDPHVVAQGLEIMRELRLGPFAKGHPQREPATEPPMRDDEIRFNIDRVATDPAGNLAMEGWAFDTRRATPLSDVYARLDGCTETALTGLPRPDVARFFKTVRATATGWQIIFPAKCVVHTGSIKLYAQAPDGRWNSVEHAP